MYSEGFETLTNLNGGEWLTNNLDTSGTWQITNLAASNGNKSAMINNESVKMNSFNVGLQFYIL